ncbi:myocardin isoform X2 [Hippocampus comes]|uniref:myocardin isoform X2 n=1 Tax=Hippocampus comes TaxID=109280 RepID=UPI00094EC557|nr:PREDICTED: myocardin-like isoform X2 [Hippocampus comes]
MTLLASERSLLIRNKFRSVLQLRIQNRRQSEINADLGLKSTSSPKNKEKDKSEAPRPTDNGAGRHPKTPPGGVAPGTVQEKSECGASRQKKARRDLKEGIRDPPAPAKPKDKAHRLHLDNGPASFALPANVFEDDISSCNSSSKRRVAPQPPAALALPSPPGLSDDQLLSDLSSVGPPLNHGLLHIQSSSASLPATEGSQPPTGTLLCESNSTAAAGRPNGIFLISPTPPLLPKTAGPPSPAGSSSPTPAFNLSHLACSRKPRDTKPKMKKLKYHQYIPPDQRGASGPGEGGAKQKSPPTQPLGAANSHLLKQQQVFLQLQILQQQQQQQVAVLPSEPVAAAATNHTPKDTNNAPKLELLPANLVDLKVSELRQQLRKRGLPVSGTKPALLQRLRPFQLPPSCAVPAPLCPPGGGTEPPTPPHPLLAHRSPSSSCSSADSPGSSPDQQTYIPDHGVPNGIVNVADGLSVSLSGEQCGPLNAVFLAPACTASGTPSPSLPMSSSSPLQCGATWRTELAVDLDKKERINCRAREASANTVQQSCARSLHPFLQQEPGCRRRDRETDTQTEVLFAQVLCSQPWPADTIGRDFELPVQITASPVQNSPGIRSLEEELQEAILKAQMDPRQSIDDILDEHTASVADPSQKCQQHSKESSFLPLCSSLLLELPPSPAASPPSHVVPPPAPPPLCTSPPLHSAGKSRKRRAQAAFEAADILETLTSGLRLLTPPPPPFAETDFSLDSDLNINRVLDLMIEQW